jgi:outer membrane protein OmpA-like peptidoglycan-associated protein
MSVKTMNRASLTLSFCILLHLNTYSKNLLEKAGYYVVVGAFSKEENARNLNKSLEQRGYNSNYGFNKSRKLYYVFTTFDENVLKCRMEIEKIRSNADFRDAWIYYNSQNNNSEVAIVISKKLEDVTKSEVSLKSNVINEVPLDTRQEVYLSLYNASNDRVVDGIISIIDEEKTLLIEQVAGNTHTFLPDPKTKSKKLTLICDAFGYRKILYSLVFDNILNDSTSSFVEDMGVSVVINFDLIKYIKGDVRTLYDVYFYNDATTMMSESKYELTLLQTMMTENPNYRIRLHGHSNGNSHGKILARSDQDDFFAMPKNLNAHMGSAKKLSLMRAETIREYLISKGVDGNRIEIKGWGGKRSLYDKHSVNAKRNVRVDVEVIQN